MIILLLFLIFLVLLVGRSVALTGIIIILGSILGLLILGLIIFLLVYTWEYVLMLFGGVIFIGVIYLLVTQAGPVLWEKLLQAEDILREKLMQLLNKFK